MRLTAKEIESKFVEAQSDLVIQSSDFSLRSVADMVREQTINPSPGYQRRERWSPKKRSALLESFLLNIPVPPIYLAEEEYGTYSVIDGKQRITAVSSYLSNGFSLQGLEKFPEINGLKFDELPKPLQNALTVRPYLRAVTLLKQSDPSLKYNVFVRLNTGGENLLAQEIRNVAYQGPLNDLLFELAENSFLRQQLKIKSKTSTAYRKMQDVELVLRFFTLRENWENFSGNLSSTMDQFMNEHRFANKPTLKKMKDMFKDSINTIEGIFGESAFRRPATEGTSWRSQFLNGVFDAEMVAASYLAAPKAKIAIKRRRNILSATRQKFRHNTMFLEASTKATNTPKFVAYRISVMKQLLSEEAKK